MACFKVEKIKVVFEKYNYLSEETGVKAHAMRAAPLALRRFFHVGIEADKMVSARARVAQDYLSPSLTYFTVILMLALQQQLLLV